VSGVDQTAERSLRAEQHIVDDLLRGRGLGIAVVPGHLHELEDVRDGQYRLVVVAENCDYPRFPLFESFGTADCDRASMACQAPPTRAEKLA
jgi:hypothetical protein